MVIKEYNCVLQVTQTYPVTEDNFEITYSGQLILNMPPNGVPPNQGLSENAAGFSSEESLKAIATTPGYDEEFQRTIERVAKGREVETIKLFKPENTSLGFSVVGLKGENNEETGIFVQDIQPGGIAARSVDLSLPFIEMGGLLIDFSTIRVIPPPLCGYLYLEVYILRI